nr:hypothetical protein [Tanacetum cinerariifolium]
MTCYVPHTYDEIKSMVEKQIQGDRGRQLALMNLGHQFDDVIIAKDELQKSYEECRDIRLEQRVLIEDFLKIESELDHQMQYDLFKKAGKMEKQIRDKLEMMNHVITNCTSGSKDDKRELTILAALQEAHDEEACLEEQILRLMDRFADKFTNRMVEINRLNSLPDQPLIEYGRYALGCMTRADMKKATYLKSVRDELLRSMKKSKN